MKRRTIQTRIEEPLAERIDQIAAHEERSLGHQISLMLRQWLKDYDRESKDVAVPMDGVFRRRTKQKTT